MQVERTTLPGVLLVSVRVHRDARGNFRETWRQAAYAAAGIPESFVQDNASVSTRGILRGLHLQDPNAQGKLVCALSGEIWDVAVDVRSGSETFGKWFGTFLSGENGRQLYIPPGFAHGFVVTSSEAVVIYKCTEAYDPASEHVLRWDDPDLGIGWPVDEPILSPRDATGKSLRELRPGSFQADRGAG